MGNIVFMCRKPNPEYFRRPKKDRWLVEEHIDKKFVVDARHFFEAKKLIEEETKWIIRYTAETYADATHIVNFYSGKWSLIPI